MDDFVRFGSRDFCLMILLLAFARGMDFLSTWVATPNLVLEGNPIAKFLGRRWGAVVNIAISVGMAFWPAPAIAVSTMSVLVASRNFQSAWLMRTMGEHRYREWHVARIEETPIILYLICLAGNTLLVAAVGVGVVFYSGNLLPTSNLISAVAPLSIGMGIVGYALAVAFYTMLAVWRLRRPWRRKSQALPTAPAILVNSAALKTPLTDSCACETGEIPGK
jgi:small-conductance mechanosensitive channel